jgi:ferric-dicitrate binding protein FerR (iron transport regulator)
MLKEQGLDWDLINKIMAGTATPEESARWEELARQQEDYAALIPWLRNVQQQQKDITSPYYAADAWQHFKATLPASAKTVQMVPDELGVFRLWKKAAMAAAVAIIIGLCWWLYPASDHSYTKTVSELITYSVPNGEKKLITLPDSTHIWINAGSLVKVPAQWGNDTLREVWLDGEGFFEVKTNSSRPFVVHTGETSIRVLGTSFNIEAYSQAPIAVTVASGKVQFTGNKGQAVILTQNQRSVWLADNGQFQTTQTDATLYNSWKEGVLQFSDEPLQQVIGRLERRFNVRMEIEGAIGSDQYCTARFASGESLDNILESFRHIYGLQITRREDTIIIQSKQKRK